VFLNTLTMGTPFPCVPTALQQWERRSHAFPLEMTPVLRMALYRPKLQIKLNCFIFQKAYPQLPCMDEMMRVRSLFYAFFVDNDGWHVTAVDLLSADNLEGTHYVQRRT